MSVYFEIAYAAASNRLCLFTGTGFSKAITENNAPSWKELLEKVCDSLPDDKKKLKNTLFPASGVNLLALDESAQVIGLELANNGRNIHDEIANYIKDIKLSGNNEHTKKFLHTYYIKFITTNYDNLTEELIGTEKCHSIAPGFPIPRSQAHAKIYHVHGSIESPQHMVVTSDDYFRFLDKESYFSRKLSTILHENTIVIIGYSLGDLNLKRIINDYSEFSKQNFISTNIFFLSKFPVDPVIKEFFHSCYSIRVLDGIEVEHFFQKLQSMDEIVKKMLDPSNENIKAALKNPNFYDDDYLRIDYSFFEIISSVNAIGKSITDAGVVDILGTVLGKKIEFTYAKGAWDQYEHLARWLVHLSSILDLGGTSIEGVFLDAVLRSMTTMSKKLHLGYSWHAYRAWSSGWSSILTSNKHIIRKHIQAKTTDPDALELVARN